MSVPAPALSGTAETALHHHLALSLGAWPPAADLDVVGSHRRVEPGWDGQLHPLRGVATPQRTLLSVPPAAVPAVRSLVARHRAAWIAGRRQSLLATLPAAVGEPLRNAYDAVFRWTTTPTSAAKLPEAGRWVPADAPGVPEWLHPFGGEVLVADGDGTHLAGVGIKRHDAYGRELAVVTTEAARGRGLARRLVAQAARRILDEGAVPTYLHDRTNIASARVAEAAGFPDRGWSAIGISETGGTEPPTRSSSETSPAEARGGRP